MSHLTRNFRSPAALLLFFGTTVVGVGIDLWTKVLAFRHLVTGIEFLEDGQIRTRSDEVKFIPGWIHFHGTANAGAVFGLGQGRRALFVAVSVAAILFLTYLFAASGRQRLYQFILGLLLAGVLGNMYD